MKWYDETYMALPFTHSLRPTSQELPLILSIPTPSFFPAGPVNSLSYPIHSTATSLVEATHPMTWTFSLTF